MKWRIFLLDGEEAIRLVVASFLERSGYSVTATDDLRSAVESCKKNPPDLILSGTCLPGIRGDEAVQFLRAYCPSIPVLKLPGFSERRVRHAQLTEDGVAVLPRPWSFQDLLLKIRETIGFEIQRLSA